MSAIKDAQKLLDILGVELGEEWEYETTIGRQKFRIMYEAGRVCWETFLNNDGDLLYERHEWSDAANVFSTDTLIDILTHPEKIAHIAPRQWTEQDADDVLAARRLFPDAYSVERFNNSKGEQVVLRDTGNHMHHAWYVRPAMFPSVKVDEGPVLLDTIMEQYQKQSQYEDETVTRTFYSRDGEKIMEYTTRTSSKESTDVELPDPSDVATVTIFGTPEGIDDRIDPNFHGWN